MKREELERRLVEFVNGMQPEADPPIVVDEETALFEEGVINSLRILDLIAFVEENTRTRVPDEAVRLANFRSVRAIAAAFGENGCGAGGHARGAPDDDQAPIHVFERRARRAGFARPVEELSARGELALVSPGRIVFRGSAESLLRYFDSVALGWGAAMAGVEQSFPSLLSIETLARAGCSVDAAPGKSVMPPAVCYHAYGGLEEARLGRAPRLLTARGRCFRNEPDLDPPLGRLRVFEMREIVALGNRSDVERFRQDMIDRVRDFVSELGLEGRIELASDPFFLQDPGRRLMQQVLPLKYELRLTLDESGHTCAVASFNHHADFFGRRFRIRLPSGATAHSGCVAFGLERWVLAFLAQHGLDERTWPATVREPLASEVEHGRIA
ncbi:MAG: aminoacyl--tRNA ligase-related protein [Gemmatimonadota bacterium]